MLLSFCKVTEDHTVSFIYYTNLFYTQTKMKHFYPLVYLFLFAVIHSPLVVYPQSITQERVSLRLSSRPMKEVLALLETKAGLHFVYDREVLPENRSVSIEVTDRPVKEVIEKVLQNTNTTYRQVGQNIVITKKLAEKKVVNGTLQGYVKDIRTNGAVVGVSVRIAGAPLGAYTDGEGQYRINSVPEGKHTVIFSAIGYRSDTVSTVSIAGGLTKELNNRLTEATEKLQEVTVTAQQSMNTTREVGMISEIKHSSAVITGISNAQITRSLDRDASDIIRRVSSATVVNDRFVLLRGLDPRYTLTMLNDFIAPSSETDTRDFSFDMIQSNVIDRITIYKSPVPELPADYVGGVVKVYTKNTATARQVQVGISTQYRTNTTFKDFYTHQGSKTDWLGFDDGSRALPKDLPNFADLPVLRDKAPYYGSRGLWQSTQKAASNLQRQTASLDKRFTFNYYDSWPLGNMRLNNLTSLAYTTTKQNQYTDGAYITAGFLGNYRRDTSSTSSVRLSGMQNLRLVINEKHSIDFNNFLNQISDDNTLLRIRNGTGDFPESEYSKILQYRYRSRTLYTGQFAGHHRFGKSQLNWRGGYGYTREQLPNYRGLGMGRLLNSDSLVPLLGNNDFGTTGGFAYWHDLKERTYTVSVDYEVPLWKSLSLKTGVYSESKNRDFTPRYFSFSSFAGGPNRVAGTIFYQADAYLNANNFNSLRPDATNTYRHELYDRTSDEVGVIGYRAKNRQRSAYAALNIPLFNDRLTIYGGMRVEYNNQQLNADKQVSATDTTTLNIRPTIATLRRDSTGTDWLPSVNVTFRINTKMQLRGGYGYTVNRPVFREVATWSFYDPLANATINGNQGLYQSKALNADLRWEWYLSNKELLSLGAYYKFMVDPIERYSVGDNKSETFQPHNSRDVKAYGVELELRKDFGFVGGNFFKNLSVIANASWMFTQTRVARNVVGSITSTSGAEPVSKDTRPLVGTSPYILNTGLYYENPAIGMQVSLLYNTAGQRLTYAGSQVSTGEIYEMPRHVIDFVYTQRLTNFLSMKVGVQDILNQAFRFYRDVNRNGKYDPAEYDLTSLAIDEGEKLGSGLENPQLGINPIPDVETIDYMEYRYRPGSYYNVGLNFTF